ncbi:SDR family NAD(P)-dependent oxidoreductase [Streptomyces sp. NPDC007983]|uniref:SDR family NAD(P)-dependent oxidoreductase n=1 Tax=Streptomyces sp. NPDC007983 TaxID=3364800 RepID=UPI0036E1B3E2
MTGKTVVITGAGSGIGRATAHAFADHGANVLAVGRTLEKLQATAQGRPSITPARADISEPGAPQAIIEQAVAAFGGVDILVNSASVFRPTHLGMITPSEFDQFVAVNLRAPLLCTQAALPFLEHAEGTVVNISAAIGQHGCPGLSVYGATKAALDFFTRSWASELAGRCIRVVSVAPGPIETPILENNGLDDQAVMTIHQTQEEIPLGRLGTPEEIAWWIVNFTDPLAGYTTGAILAVDGGYTVA